MERSIEEDNWFEETPDECVYVESYTPFNPPMERLMKNDVEEMKTGVPVPYSEKETDMILRRYIDNYEVYHHSLSGSGGTKYGISGKKRFIADLTEDINALGVAKRTEKQIDQKIRDEIKVLKKYGNCVIAERNKTGGGRVGQLPRLSASQKMAFDALQGKPRITGTINGAAMEVGHRPIKRKVEPPLEECRIIPAIESLSKVEIEESPTKSNGRTPSRNDLMKLEMETMLLKRTLIKKKCELADIQIDYWTKRSRHLPE